MTEEKPEDGNAAKDIKLPDDHPLVTAYNTVKEQLKQAKSGSLPPEEMKALQEKAKKLDELEAANKTETEKLAEQLATVTKELNGYRTQAEQAKQRAEVAKAKGLPESLLRGSSKEEFEEHADALIAAGIKPAAAPSSEGQGDTGDGVSEGDEKSADEIVAAATSR